MNRSELLPLGRLRHSLCSYRFPESCYLLFRHYFGLVVYVSQVATSTTHLPYSSVLGSDPVLLVALLHSLSVVAGRGVVGSAGVLLEIGRAHGLNSSHPSISYAVFCL